MALEHCLLITVLLGQSLEWIRIRIFKFKRSCVKSRAFISPHLLESQKTSTNYLTWKKERKKKKKKKIRLDDADMTKKFRAVEIRKLLPQQNLTDTESEFSFWLSCSIVLVHGFGFTFCEIFWNHLSEFLFLTTNTLDKTDKNDIT